MGKLFTPEYKKQCVEMVLDGKHSVTQVCKMMRVSQSALNSWRRQIYYLTILTQIEF
ncbi:transposase [Avibacterium avium]|uniref:Transposase n=1 Tax=Pasteurella canis TaxID=753 RepID=A0A379ERK6_9PAST|nr:MULTISPECIES: transposase [Pasteurella]MEB3484230.1 transposase [Pasteurella multocida]MEB3493799.1 transposase [Pasteurella multocida]URK01767.1 transposase [Pasteurella multocida]SUC03287.1 Transposase [Pasteurella canis]SUC10404.1 Transposase [Pasteurella canis]